MAFGATLAASPFSRRRTFPTLTGRVVDQADVLSAEQRASLEGKLKDLEDKSGIQLVVATVSSLDGLEVEPYANQLFRAWKLGEAKKNNGVLFLIAPKEHKLRIEVGYGLEGTLTDATSKIIILNAVAPRFKAGDFDGGVSRGVDDIITTLTTDSSEWQKRPELRAEDDATLLDAVAPFLFIAIFVFVFWRIARPGGRPGQRRRSSRSGFGGGRRFVRRRRLRSAAAAAFPAAAARRAAAAPRGAGDADRARRRCQNRSGDPRRASALDRPDRLRARARLVELRDHAADLERADRARGALAAADLHHICRASAFSSRSSRSFSSSSRRCRCRPCACA